MSGARANGSAGAFRVVDVINLGSSAAALLRDRVLAMRARGFDNRILCIDGPHVAGLRRAGIPVHTVSLPRGLDPFRLLIALAQVTFYLWRERVDLVHTHCSVPGAVGRVAAWLARVPVVVHTVHGFHFHERRGVSRRLAIDVERLCGGLTHALLTQNREDLGLAHAYGIGPAARRLWIGNGIDVERFRPRHAPPAGGRPPVITCVARFEPVKNHAFLLAAAALLARHGERFRLQLVGDGPGRAACEARCAALGIADRVDFLGRREDVDQVLAGSDVAALVSLKEGLPRAVLEAMACGVPVVATRVPGTREAVRDGDTGLLVELGDVAQLAAALSTLLRDPGRRAAMGVHARECARREFDERKVIAALERVYRAQLRELAPRAAAPARHRTPVPPVPPVPAEAPEPRPAGASAGAAVTVGRNFSFRLVAQVGSALLNVAALALLGRGLSAAGYGEYAFYYALIPLLAAAGDAGVGIVATREIARDPARMGTWFGDAILLRLAVSGAVFALVLGGCAVLDRAHVALFAIVGVAALLEFAQDPAIWVLRARERFDLEGLLLLASQTVWIVLLALAVRAHAGLAALLAAAPAAFAVRSTIGIVLAARGGHRPRFAPARERLARHVAQGAPFGVAMFGSVLYGRVGVLLLKAFSSSTEIAHFNVAYLLSQPLGFIASALGLAIFPALARRARGDGAAVRAALRHTVRAQVLVTFPLSVGLWFLAAPIIGVLFHGRGFERAAVALQLMCPSLTLIFLNLVARYALTALDAQAEYLKGIALGLVLNTVLGVVLIPGLGARGACLAYLGAEAGIAVVCMRAIGRRVPLAGLVRDSWRPLAAAAGMALVLAATRGAGPWLSCALGAGVYAVLLWRSGALAPEDLEVARRIAASFRPGRAPARARRTAEAAPAEPLVAHVEGGPS